MNAGVYVLGACGFEMWYDGFCICNVLVRFQGICWSTIILAVSAYVSAFDRRLTDMWKLMTWNSCKSLHYPDCDIDMFYVSTHAF